MSAEPEDPPERREPTNLLGERPLLVLGVAAIVLLVVGAAIGMLIGQTRLGGSSAPSANSVDVGFSQDMRVHHLQAITMAGIERDKTTDPELHTLAFDIESTQLAQAGEMDGWLTAWERSELPDAEKGYMSWMTGASGHQHGATNAAGGVAVMPGMATTAELNKLRTLSGKEMDVYFLQLMLRHHQGALPMAQYAAVHATVGYVRDLGAKMVAAQSNEIRQMADMLTARNAEPLPAPS